MKYAFICLLYWPLWAIFAANGNSNLGALLASFIVLVALGAQSKFDYNTWQFWKALRDES